MSDGSPDPKGTDRHRLQTALEAIALPGGARASCDISESARNGLTCHDYFTDDAALEEAFAYQRSFCEGADRKACATFMLSDYLATLMAVLAPLFVIHRIVPSLAPDDVALRFQTEATPPDHPGPPLRRMHLCFLSPDPAATGGQAERAPTPELTDRFRSEIERHSAPLISRLSALTGLAPAAFWRLVADAIAAAFLMAGREIGRQPMTKDLALKIMKGAGSPLHNPQLHFFELDLADGSEPPRLMSFRGRGGCCRFYAVEGGRLYATCVLKAPAPRDRDLRSAMRRRLGLGG
ncbi:ferric iron reductase [Salipiger abyssi]|uniref:Ferric iron reductase FhuF-like transporter n=1 Tax=Salipiger abyssi TaxID=1250539 RepID=A0A1P8UP27_9RHOB|nr:ferric iron reductase [Salipiger abyssi]APZ51159.1 Ferric iron reductase FhuF-like transporter [Salipiger abyssi]